MRMKNKLTTRARSLRKTSTDAEQKLWRLLRANQLADYKFRRQAVIGNYIIDFVCYDKKLIVELDGSQHMEQQHYDDARTQWLTAQGFKVLRFWNNQMLNETDAVLEVIMRELENIHSGLPPHPNPLPRGARE
jgi:very-short-patch-repair endonuclease